MSHEPDDAADARDGEERDTGQPEHEAPGAEEALPEVADGSAAEPAEAVGPSSDTPEGEATSPPAEGDSPSDTNMRWYVLRVASNREDQVLDALKRKVKIEHLEDRVGRILVLTQREKRMRGGVAKVYDRKLYPGYIFVEMATDEDGSVPDDVWYVIKDTTGVGDFIGSDGKPSAMKPHDVEQMLGIVDKVAEQPTLAGMAGMKKGDPIKVKEGPFENFEGEIDEVYPDKGQVKVIVTIFGRATPIELEYWQIEAM
ncbi:MAG: transcription termination/antitermination protein NusG [Phycisphaerae bacterium]